MRSNKKIKLVVVEASTMLLAAIVINYFSKDETGATFFDRNPWGAIVTFVGLGAIGLWLLLRNYRDEDWHDGAS